MEYDRDRQKRDADFEALKGKRIRVDLQKVEVLVEKIDEIHETSIGGFRNL